MPTRARLDLGTGRIARAIVFASTTLAATATGCAHRQKAADEMGEPRHGGGGCVDPDPKQIAELEQQKAEIDKQPDSAEKNAAEHDIDEKLREARMPQCMPYGAPPARRRIV